MAPLPTHLPIYLPTACVRPACGFRVACVRRRPTWLSRLRPKHAYRGLAWHLSPPQAVPERFQAAGTEPEAAFRSGTERRIIFAERNRETGSGTERAPFQAPLHG
jgi:hypothetical protein